MEQTIRLLGDPVLYEVSRPIAEQELPGIAAIVEDMRDTIIAFRARYGCGRAIAAPQIGLSMRLIVTHIDGETTAYLNPRLSFPDEEKMELWDDCFSFPNLLVRLQRYRRCVIEYKDLEWNDCRRELEGDLSELLQHEYDHLDGILAVMRAESPKDYRWRESR